MRRYIVGLGDRDTDPCCLDEAILVFDYSQPGLKLGFQMNVLHVIPSLAPCHGGPSVVLPVIERALTAEGVTVETVTTDDDGPGQSHAKGDGEARTENGVVRRYFAKQTEFYKVSLPLARWVREEARRFDLIHIHALFSHTSVAAARGAAAAGVPYLVRPLGVLNQYGVTQRRTLLKRLSLRWIEGPLLRRAAAVHFTMDAEREEAEKLGIPFESVVIPLGVEGIDSSLSHGDEGQSVIFLSRIDPKKNVECLLQAWRRCNDAHCDWRLKIAGDGRPHYLSKLQALTRKLGIDSSVDWLGQVEGKQKQRLIQEASIFALPSHSENFGIAAAEALLAGKACVFTAGVAVGAVAAKRGAARLSEAQPQVLADNLLELMNDPDLRTDLASRARTFAENELSSGVMGQRLVKLYRRVMDTRST